MYIVINVMEISSAKYLNTQQGTGYNVGICFETWLFIDENVTIYSLTNDVFLVLTPLFVVCMLNSSPPSAAYMRHWTYSPLVQIMACRLFSAKPLSKPMLGYCQLDPWEQIMIKIQNFSFTKCIWKYRLRNGCHFVQGEGGEELNIIYVIKNHVII